MNRKYWLLLGLATFFASLASACSSEFDSCEARRTCPAGGGGGKVGSAGVGGEAGDKQTNSDGPSAAAGTSSAGDAGSGGVGGAGGDESGSGGEGGAEEPILFGACSTLRQIACSGHASAERLACDGSKWLAGPTCAAGQLCDSRTGECAKIVPDCADAAPGQIVCRGDKLLSCGVDLISASEDETCDGLCKAGVCQKPVCGDQKVEAGEECDDSKSASSGCGPDCKAICGDGVVLAGYEQCDDNNLNSGDGCSADCNWEPTALAAGDVGTCALSEKIGQVKCWGGNSYGQLGLGDSDPRGVNPGEIEKLPAIQLGTGRKVKAISSGHGVNCALLDNGSVKCWGLNTSGELGIGAGLNRGDKPLQMGDALPPIKLIGNLTATSISAGYRHACAVANGGVQCWGSGVAGQLGQGDTALHAEPVGIYDFGQVSNVSVSAGGAYNCELLQTGKIICWGDNGDGQLSYSNEPMYAAVGDEPDEMKDLFPVAFSQLTAKAVAPGIASACALLSDDSVRCWGSGEWGQLGSEDSEPQGTIPYTIASVPPVALGTGRKPKAITSGARHVCALLDNATIKCWGDNRYGQLGNGGAGNIGAKPGTMGDNLKAVDLGTGRTARQVVAGENHTCALLDNGTIKCWGQNLHGELGLGDRESRPSPTLYPVSVSF
ncbi:MAG TPA: DUF4215 domain-containing protein [Polyangiaceae bacterium]|nr:DUF4215 domain-containing protein [Polyangiaceae bacterium]